MAKRFTDTEKWRDEWWGSLDNDYRMIWLYLVDSCSISGIWKKDFRGLNFNCNTRIDETRFKEVFGDRVIDGGNYFFLPKFLRFQYPRGLNSKKPAIVSVVKELSLYNLTTTVNELFGNDYLTIEEQSTNHCQMIKDKDKDTDKDKDKDKDSDKDGGKLPEYETDAFSDQRFAEIFDDLLMESIHSTFREHDLAEEMKIFKLKVRGSPADYAHRDTGGMRQAFIYQLKNSKPHARKPAKNVSRGADARITAKRRFGQL